MTVQLERVLLAQLIEVLLPLANLGDPDGLTTTIGRAGWDVEALGLPDANVLSDSANALAQILVALNEKIAYPDLLALTDVAAHVAKCAASVNLLLGDVARLQWPPGLPSNVSMLLAQDIAQLLLADQLASRFPRASLVLRLLGLLDEMPVTRITRDDDGRMLRPAGSRLSLELQSVGDVLKDPLGFLRSYVSDSAKSVEAIADAIGPDIAGFLTDAGLIAGYGIVPAEPQIRLTADEQLAAARLLIVDLATRDAESGGTAFARLATGLVDQRAIGQGLGFLLGASGGIGFSRTGDVGTATGAFTAATRPLILDAKGMRFADGSNGVPELSVSAGFESGQAVKPVLRLGAADSTHFAIDRMSMSARLAFGDQTDFGGSIAINGARLVVRAVDGDGFLKQCLPADAMTMDGDLELNWSLRTGLRVRGEVAFEKRFASGKSVGPVTIVEAIVGLNIADSALGFEMGGSFALALGPLRAAIQRFGVVVRAQPSKSSNANATTFGSLGAFDFSMGVLPPSGVALSIDTAAIRGGGGLQIQPDMYSGQLQLCINNVIDLTAIGLINTKLPGGAAGFALLVLITAKFQPIQLGYGFTLNGVGGLAALNHSMNQQALSDGVRNHTLDSILFPTNPVANANKIISDLQRVFPVTPGRFVFAPMVEIGWGGSVLLIDVALVVDLPSPLRLTILGRMHLLLPPATAGAKDDKAKVVVVHLDVQGSLDLDQSAILVDAQLYDSRLALFPITGGMALRIRWGAQPQFLLAIGGFNPRFTPPPGFPVLDRVGIQMRYDKDGVRAGLCLTSYVAVTTNTLQFGARIDAYAEVSIAKLAGYLGFDALVEMVPFHVVLDLYGGVSVEAFGFKFSCDLLLTLAAFDPVTGDGYVTIDFLGKHEVPIHFSIGDAKPLPALPVADALHELKNALEDAANWSAGVPSDAGMVVNLRPPTAAEVAASAGKPLAHPLARLSVRQRVLPFKVALQRFGAATPSQPGPFDIAALTVGSATAAPPASTALHDDFARGQYLVLSDDDKLCAPQFESFVCGYDGLGTEGACIATSQVAEFSYDTRVIDDRAQPAKSLPDVVVSYDYARRMGQVSAPPVAAAARYAAPPKGIKVGRPQWKSVGTDNMDAHSPDTFDTYTQAQAHRRAQPGSGRKQVVESFELV